jgi:hypothetical protein
MISLIVTVTVSTAKTNPWCVHVSEREEINHTLQQAPICVLCTTIQRNLEFVFLHSMIHGQHCMQLRIK